MNEKKECHQLSSHQHSTWRKINYVVGNNFVLHVMSWAQSYASQVTHTYIVDIRHSHTRAPTHKIQSERKPVTEKSNAITQRLVTLLSINTYNTEKVEQNIHQPVCFVRLRVLQVLFSNFFFAFCVVVSKTHPPHDDGTQRELKTTRVEYNTTLFK